MILLLQKDSYSLLTTFSKSSESEFGVLPTAQITQSNPLNTPAVVSNVMVPSSHFFRDFD